MKKKFILMLLILFAVVATVIGISKFIDLGKERKQARTDQSGDTSVESLGALGSGMKQIQDQLANLKTQQQVKEDQYKEEKDTLEKTISELSSTIDSVSASSQEQVEKFTTLIDSLLKNEKPDMPVGNTLNIGADGLVWTDPSYTYENDNAVEPLNAKSSQAGQVIDGFLDKAQAATNRVSSIILPGGNANQSILNQRLNEQEEPPVPVYTIPPNATLFNADAMSGLIGRVPIGGTVRYPIRFKIIIGKENLISNGITLPGIEESVWSGYAFGDRTLNCVRGVVDTVLFTFTDGRIYSQKSEPRSRDTNVSNAFEDGDALGWISDERGGCITGEYISNAPENLTKMFVAGFASGAASASAQSQRSVISNGDTITSVFDGSASKYALGAGASEGFDAWADYIEERAREDFDVVFAPSGTKVVINVTNTIPIDYKPNERKVSYYDDYEIQGSSHGQLD